MPQPIQKFEYRIDVTVINSMSSANALAVSMTDDFGSNGFELIQWIFAPTEFIPGGPNVICLYKRPVATGGP